MVRILSVVMIAGLGLGLVSCGGSESASTTDIGISTPIVGSSDASIDESDLGNATITVEPEGRTFAVSGECEIAPAGFEVGIVADLSTPGVEVSIVFDNIGTDSTGDFPMNMTAVTSVRDDGTFNVRSRGGVDNESVSFSGDGTAAITESNGVYGRVSIEFILVQSGPVSDPSGPPVFDDQPATRTITGDLICIIGIS